MFLEIFANVLKIKNKNVIYISIQTLSYETQNWAQAYPVSIDHPWDVSTTWSESTCGKFNWLDTDLGKGTKKCLHHLRSPRTQWPPSFLNRGSLEPPRLFLKPAARPNWAIGGEGSWSCDLKDLFPPASLHGPLLLFWDWFALFAAKYIHL